MVNRTTSKLFVGISACLTLGQASAQTGESLTKEADKPRLKSEKITIVGSRVSGRQSTDTNSPVDIMDWPHFHGVP